MSDQVRIYNFRALTDTKIAIIHFAEQVTGALASMDADVSRVSMWLNMERPAYWKGEVRRREDEVLKAKTEISRKIIAAAPDPPSLVLERKALQRAQQRLEDGRKRQEKVRFWAPKWDREALSYKGSTHDISEALHRDIPLALARLEKMLAALEAYAKMAAPKSVDDPGEVTSEVAEAARDDAGAAGGTGA